MICSMSYQHLWPQWHGSHLLTTLLSASRWSNTQTFARNPVQQGWRKLVMSWNGTEIISNACSKQFLAPHLSIKMDSNGTYETCYPSMKRLLKLAYFATLFYVTFSDTLNDKPDKTNWSEGQFDVSGWSAVVSSPWKAIEIPSAGWQLEWWDTRENNYN